MFIKDCCIINPNKNKQYNYFNYIDTSSVLDGKLVGLQRLYDNFPSRAQREVNKNDILISSVRPNLKHNYFVNKVIDNCIASTGFIQVRCNNNVVLSRYVYYLLTNNTQIKEYIKIADSSQTTFPTFNKDIIENVIIKHPDRSTQQHIVDSIGSVDDAIEKNEDVVGKLEKYGLQLFEQHLSNEITPLSEIVDCISGGAFKSSEYVTNSNYKLITIKNIDENGFNTLNVDFLRETAIDNKYLLQLGDLVVTMTGNVGRIGIVDELNCYLNQRLLKIEGPSKLYFYMFIKSNINNIINLARGTAQKNLSLIDFQKLPINNSKSEIIDFAKYDDIFYYILKLKIINNKLKHIKCLLLNKYFN